jgi:hypothetical protein
MKQEQAMRMSGRICAALGILLVAGCNVTVNNQSADKELNAAADGVENVAADAERAADRAGNTIERKVDSMGNVNVDVKVRDHDAADNRSR